MIEIFEKASLPPKQWRTRCLRELPQAQELFVENLLQNAQTFEIFIDKKFCGYASVADATMLEFYLEKKHLAQAGAALSLIAQASAAQAVLCKSFDTNFLDACRRLNWSVEPVALLFRKIVDNSLPVPFPFTVQMASEGDIPEILQCHDGFFHSLSEIHSYLAKDAQLFLYRVEGSAIGCGIVKKIVECRADYDIGMVVAPAHRGKGFGTQILHHLKHSVLRAGCNPVAGCSADNAASKRTLEKSGFISEHELLKFSRR